MRGLIAYLLLFCLVGCTTGHDFPRPTPDSLVLGQSMRAEILRTYGRPYRETSAVLGSKPTEAVTKGEFDMTPVSGSFATLIYLYADRTRQVLMGSMAPTSKVKVVVFSFWNDTLVFYNFVSSFQDDSSDFDETRIAEIRKGQSTKAAIVQLFGPPTGRAIYPAVQSEANEKYMYNYAQPRGGQRYSKRLEILFGAEGSVMDYRFVSDSEPLPAQPRPTTTTVPIFIPQAHR